MPTHDEEAQFLREFFSLPEDKRRLFRRALRLMVEDSRQNRPFRASLRVRAVQGYSGVFEMTWDMPNGGRPSTMALSVRQVIRISIGAALAVMKSLAIHNSRKSVEVLIL